MNGWIFQRTSELGSGDHALNSSRFLFRLDRPPVYHRSPEIPPSERDEILQGCYILNSAPSHRSNRQTDARGGGDSGYDFAVQKKKTARSLEGNVDGGPPSSIDDSSVILIEIRVDV